MAEIIKLLFSSSMISQSLEEGQRIGPHILHLIKSSSNMFFLACMYGAMNILSFVALQNIDAGTFTILAQLKILTTAFFSTILLHRRYSSVKWRALIELMLGVLLFSSHIFSHDNGVQVPYRHPSHRRLFVAAAVDNVNDTDTAVYPILGISAVLIEVTTSGFASIYFEKVLKSKSNERTIWERNLQLAASSIPIYICFILYNGGGEHGFGAGWTRSSCILSVLGASGGVLVALTIKYADAILKTLATTFAIVLSSMLDHFLLDGPLTPTMMIGGGFVVLAICNYTFDPTPPDLLTGGVLPMKAV